MKASNYLTKTNITLLIEDVEQKFISRGFPLEKPLEPHDFEKPRRSLKRPSQTSRSRGLPLDLATLADLKMANIVCGLQVSKINEFKLQFT